MSKDVYLRRGDFDFCLAHVVEECGKVMAAAGKTQRWGRKSYNPELPLDDFVPPETNEQWLMREITDLEEAIARLKDSMFIPNTNERSNQLLNEDHI